jgi:hypothetical protein
LSCVPFSSPFLLGLYDGRRWSMMDSAREFAMTKAVVAKALRNVLACLQQTGVVRCGDGAAI